jgi:hypothetical protein
MAQKATSADVDRLLALKNRPLTGRKQWVLDGGLDLRVSPKGLAFGLSAIARAVSILPRGSDLSNDVCVLERQTRTV